MRLDELPRSDNVEDRRSEEGGASFRIPGGRGGLGIGTIIVLGLVGYWLGIDPSVLIGGAEILTGGGTSQQQSSPAPRDSAQTGAPSDQMGQFVSAVLGSTEAQWQKIFAQYGKSYEPPTLVMFSGATRSACGFAQSAMGPFYCPNDRKVYLDTSFFQDLERRFRACDAGSKSCQFSQAYVIAHEVGHHVQNLLGISDKVHSLQSRASKAEANELSTRLELQADFLAGVWANHAQKMKQILEVGDVETALRAAEAIGDDRLQMEAQGYVVPDSFTHGTSKQRMKWFTKGLKTGNLNEMDTFNAEDL
jgi:predicted metalloprotease